MYERVWDESDYVIPPSENNAFFVMTNVVLTPNQTRMTCPEDPTELPEVICGYRNTSTSVVNITEGICVAGHTGDLVKSHGTATGNCIESDRKVSQFWIIYKCVTFFRASLCCCIVVGIDLRQELRSILFYKVSFKAFDLKTFCHDAH